MRPDERLLADLSKAMQKDSADSLLLQRCERTIRRLIRQKQATNKLIQAAKAMYESTGITMEMRNALEEYDGRKNRPMIDWPVHWNGGKYVDL